MHATDLICIPSADLLLIHFAVKALLNGGLSATELMARRNVKYLLALFDKFVFFFFMYSVLIVFKNVTETNSKKTPTG